MFGLCIQKCPQDVARASLSAHLVSASMRDAVVMGDQIVGINQMKETAVSWLCASLVKRSFLCTVLLFCRLQLH